VDPSTLQRPKSALIRPGQYSRILLTGGSGAWRFMRELAAECRSASPWDDATRRPSHADRRNASATSSIGRKTRRLWQRLLKLAA
jgi:hypothetical protein